jgi:formate hydrogenlyase subunit 3/multisubunit Na+/H+ antiporter MnhD subunit
MTSAVSFGGYRGRSVAFAATWPALAGIPLAAGFIVEFHLVASGVDGSHDVPLRTSVAQPQVFMPAGHRGDDGTAAHRAG